MQVVFHLWAQDGTSDLDGFWLAFVASSRLSGGEPTFRLAWVRSVFILAQESVHSTALPDVSPRLSNCSSPRGLRFPALRRLVALARPGPGPQGPWGPVSRVEVTDQEMQKKENAGAFFVLPSQMNAAEYPDCP